MFVSLANFVKGIARSLGLAAVVLASAAHVSAADSPAVLELTKKLVQDSATSPSTAAAPSTSPATSPASTSPPAPIVKAPEVAPAATGVTFTHESLKTRLEDMGYEVKVVESSQGTPIYVLNFMDGNFRHIVNVCLSKDLRHLFFDMPLKVLADENMPAERVTRLLAKNSEIFPMMFRWDTTHKQVYLLSGIENKNITPQRFREEISKALRICRETQPLWNPDHWQPLPAKAPAVAPVAVEKIDPASDLGKLQGKWIIVEGSSNGQPLSKETIDQRIAVDIQGSKFSMSGSSAIISVESKTAEGVMTILCDINGTKSRSLARFEGETLVMCARIQGYDAPPSFAAGPKIILFKLQREAPATSVSVR